MELVKTINPFLEYVYNIYMIHTTQDVYQYTDCAILIAQIVEPQVLLQSTNPTLKLHCPLSVENEYFTC